MGALRKLLPAALAAAAVLTACQAAPPISVGHRDSVAGQGIVLTVTNTSGGYLHEIVVTIRSPEGEVKTFSTATLEPHETINVGWLKLDGWPIPEGSEVTVSCKGFFLDSGPWEVSS